MNNGGELQNQNGADPHELDEEDEEEEEEEEEDLEDDDEDVEEELNFDDVFHQVRKGIIQVAQGQKCSTLVQEIATSNLGWVGLVDQWLGCT